MAGPVGTTAIGFTVEGAGAVLQRRAAAERLGDDIAELSARIQAATCDLLVLIRAFDEREGWAGYLMSARGRRMHGDAAFCWPDGRPE